MPAIVATKIAPDEELDKEALPSAPRVAVLMPAYNPGPTIKQALESLVQNTYPCDVYVVDDGSRPPIAELLGDFPGTNVIRLDENRGVAHARNIGLKAILSKSYEFVALLDADDVSYPHRLATQVEFLDRHPEIAAVGGWARWIEEGSGRTIRLRRTPENPSEVKKTLFYNAAVSNSTAMIRTDALRVVGLYSERYPVAEDYELFRRISQRYPIANIPAVLIDYRVSLGGLSRTRRHRQLFDRLRIQLKYFEPLEPSAWTGVLKTILLFFFPASFIARIKGTQVGHEAGPPSPGV